MSQNTALPALFHTTQWSMVLAAAEDSGSALERLCRTYWRPLYGYARRTGRSPEDAEDMVQGFLAKVLEKQWLAGVRKEAGPFRRFLQMAFKNYLFDQYDREQTKKRGGGTTAVPLDAPGAEAFYHRELASMDTPETAYERAWALEVFARARAALRRECVDSGREALYDALQTGDSQAAISERTGTTVSAINSFAFRVRRRLQELIREEILQTVGSRDDLESEVASLLKALSSR